MSRTSYILNMAACMALLFASIACQKDLNPPVENLPAVDFQYSVLEQRQLKAFTWTPASNSGPLSNGEESIKQLYVTAFNEVVIEASSPVNVSSTQPGYVAVEKVTSKKYRLVYKSDGTSHIKIWNGTEGQNAVVKGFDVIGLEYVDVTGLRFTYGGEPLVVKHVVNSRPKVYCKKGDEDPQFPQRPKETDFTWFQYIKPNIWVDDPDKPGYGTFVVDPTQGALMRFEGFEPENTSFRTVSAFESEWDFCFHMTERLSSRGYIEEGMYTNWPNESGVNKDVGEYAGREIWIAEVGAPTYVACVKVDTKNSTKYLLLYHGEEPE
ncbi:MAG: hypothetical protein E7109_02215 [Bacteroidales bacterium]|nr:hypothetical protein [Bacteroidales bacterium]